jgi:hypothetical protein
MITKTKIALVVALVLCVVPSAMAQSRTHHAHITHLRVIHSHTSSDQWLRNPGYAGPVYSVNPTGFHPGYAGPVIQDDRFASHSDRYDGDRYWSGDNCFPTEPGGCD